MLRIIRVEIQGFKTFAKKTEFVFDPGVTAIVGPNGSGKSNVADAVRWCLGEQSFATLRSKKTADVIFAGSDKRARLNMAYVSLTLDNRNGELPIEFSEVVVSRRAFRDGENEYLLNGKRVRLTDITQLLAPSGLGKRTYAVIGQGLIDQVLTLKPDERRILFEEAAGITGYQLQRSAALRRLEATLHNLERVDDIVAELSPRLGYLRRQAEKARQREKLAADLNDMLRIWYGYAWHAALAEQKQQNALAAKAATAVEQRRRDLDALSGRIEEMRRSQKGLRETLAQHHEESSRLHQKAQSLSRALAVAEERQRQLRARSEDTERELADLRTTGSTLRERLGAASAAILEAQAEYEQRHRAAAELAEQLERVQQQQQARRASLEQAQAEERRLRDQVSGLRSRLEQANERLQKLTEEELVHKQTNAEASAAVEEAEQKLAQCDTRINEAATERDHFGTEIKRLAAIQDDLRAELESADAERLQSERTLDRLQTRYEVLQRLRNEGAGYASGVRAVLQAAGRKELNGILGTVASALRVPADMDKAVETALGGAFQNLIARNWDDAQQAIEFLKQGRGRATFLPLDKLRIAKAIPAVGDDGILGNAVDLIEFDPEVAPAIQQLLNRTWIASDLKAARRALDRKQGRLPTVVTLSGEIVRAGGSVTGGNDGRRRDDSILARERERRQLPGQIKNARQQTVEAASRRSSVESRLQQSQLQLAQLQKTAENARQAEQKAQQSREEARSALARAEQQLQWHRQRVAENRREQESLCSNRRQLQQSLAEQQEQLEKTEKQVASCEAALDRQKQDALVSQLVERRAAEADARAALRSRETILEGHRAALTGIETQIKQRSERLQTLQTEQVELASSIAGQQSAADELNAMLSKLATRSKPLEQELARLAAAQEEAEQTERAGQAQLRQDERDAGAAELARQRIEDRLDMLERDIRRDLLQPPDADEGDAETGGSEEDTAAPAAGASPQTQGEVSLSPSQQSDAATADRNALGALLPVVATVRPELEEQVRKQRNRLQRLQAVNPEAPREYEEAAKRHTFLVEQADDLRRAETQLRRVIRELDDSMETALRSTFAAVATEFIELFQLLFQGGTAKLVLSDPENVIESGVEIIARPPGKRPQSLELLSGGERSLTACALIFAILRTSPTPFCILDEVDAALDEANVDRFRTVLESIRDRTQFILITHNRRTLEASNTLYGITMGDDGVSKVISLQISDQGLVPAEAASSETAAVAL